MSLARLFSLGGKGRVHDPERPWSGPQDQTPIHGLLDQRGVPWRATRDELVERFGAEGEGVLIPTSRPFLPAVVGPLRAEAQVDAAGRASVFTALSRYGDDPAEDVRRTAEEIGQYLGRARVSRTGEEWGCLWRFGSASLSLRGTPRGCEIRIRTA
jgi:hypothetical protein